jgi:endonuclease YncB( thermonuclease family)
LINRATVAGLVATAVIGTAFMVAASPAEAAEAVVTKLIDGDTFDVSIDGRTERIRMLNIDTPETKDPDEVVQCLGPEASDFLATLIPVGTTVKLEYDEEQTDRYDRTLAGVLTTDGTLVNAEVARAGLGRAVVYGDNDRFLPSVQAAQQEAAANGRGLYSADVGCTLPGQVQAVTDTVAATPTAASQPADTSAAELESAAAEAAAAVSTAAALRDAFRRARHGIVWDAFSLRDQARFASRVAEALNSAQVTETGLRTAVTRAKAHEAEAARIAVEAEAARIAAEAAAPRAAERQRAAQAAARRSRAAAPTAPKAPAAKRAPRPAPAPAPATQTNPYPGYTGPRCYAPGGQTWQPCP